MSDKQTKPQIDHKNRPTLKIVHLNVERSILTKKPSIEFFLQETNPDFFMVSEHGLDEIGILNVVFPGFTLVNSFCRQALKWGGVAIYKSNFCKLEVKVCDLANRFCREQIFEITSVKVVLDGPELLLAAIYRSPDAVKEGEFLDLLNDWLEASSVPGRPLVLGGDLNIDLLGGSAAAAGLGDILASFGLTNAINTPTRYGPNTESCIDNFLTNQEFENNLTLDPFISDHLAISLDIILHSCPSSNQTETVTFRDLSDCNLREFKYRLSKEKWLGVFQEPLVDDKYGNLINTIKYNLDVSCPLKSKKKVTGRPKSNGKIFSKEIQISKSKVMEAFALWKENKTEDRKYKYNLLKKAHRKLIKQNKASFFLDKISESKNPTKTSWDIINKNRPSKKCVESGVSIKINNSVISEPLEVSNNFNNFFVNVHKTIDANSLPKHFSGFPLSAQKDCVLWHFPKIETQIVRKTLMKLQSKNSTGMDGLSVKMLKYCSDELVQPLTHIVNASLNDGIFPHEAKVAIVKPLFKKGDPQLMENYRPISLLPAVSKVLEKIVCEIILNFLENNDLFFRNQFGFRKNKSTKLALIDFVQKSIDALEKGEVAVGCFVDLSKAFDCVDTAILIEKIAALGIGGVVLKWISSYLQNRIQITSVKHKDLNKPSSNTFSDPKIIQSGVPQGSILGPLFFLIYVNDVSQYVDEGSLTMFADDTTLFTRNKCIQSLEVDTFVKLNTLSQFFSDNKLAINAGKTSFVQFQTSQREFHNAHNHIDVILGESEINKSVSANFLGVLVDSHLKWDEHVRALSAKLAGSLYVLREFGFLGNVGLSKLIYFSLFESHIRYSIVLWGSSSKKHLNCIFKYQKRAIRSIAGVPPRTSCCNLFKNLQIMTVPSIYIFETIMFVKSRGVILGKTHNYNTRHKSDNSSQQHNLKLFELKPEYVGHKYFQLLPHNLKEIENINKFRYELKLFLTEQATYVLPNLSIRNHLPFWNT
jgi:hypothetical protein